MAVEGKRASVAMLLMSVKRPGNDVALLSVEILHFKAGIAEAEAIGEVDELIVVTARSLLPARWCNRWRSEYRSDAETPVAAAAPEALLSLPALAVGAVVDAGTAMRLEAVFVARRAERLDFQERKARAVANAEGALDDLNILDIAGVDLAADGIQIDASGEPVGAVGIGSDLAEVQAFDARIGDESGAFLDFDADRAVGLREQIADVAGIGGGLAGDVGGRSWCGRRGGGLGSRRSAAELGKPSQRRTAWESASASWAAARLRVPTPLGWPVRETAASNGDTRTWRRTRRERLADTRGGVGARENPGARLRHLQRGGSTAGLLPGGAVSGGAAVAHGVGGRRRLKCGLLRLCGVAPGQRGRSNKNGRYCQPREKPEPDSFLVDHESVP